jgi:hypothetical protein
LGEQICVDREGLGRICVDVYHMVERGERGRERERERERDANKREIHLL